MRLAAAEAPDVVREADDVEHQDERDADDRDTLVDLAAHGPAAKALDEREGDVAAVERQERQQVEERQRQAQEAEHPEVALEALVERLRGDLGDPDRARDLLPHLVVHEALDDEGRPLRDLARQLQRVPHGRWCREAGSMQDEAEAVHAVFLLRSRRPERDALSVPPDDEGQRAPVRPCDAVPDLGRRDSPAVDRDDAVAGLEPDLRGRRVRLHLGDLSGQLAAGEHEEDGEEHQGEEQVRPRAGEDDGDLLPRALAPVGVGAEGVAKLLDPALRGLARPGRERRVGQRLLDRVELAPGSLHLPLLEPAAERRDEREELRPLRDRPAEVHVRVRGRRTVHPRDLHVAAERDRPEAVLDPVPVPLDERRREADVAAARVHPDRAGGEEVAGLVDEDEEAEAEDRDDGHAGWSPRSATRRAAASASTRSARSRAGAPSAAARASSTTSALPRKGSRPSRNAATATSFAAL